MVTTVSTKGQFVIPAEIREQLGIEPGTKMSVSVEGSRIVLQMVERRIDELRGIFKSDPERLSATDDLIAERRADDQRFEERLAGISGR
jgi:AbrB family looped-hinge helix DNA binding protein